MEDLAEFSLAECAGTPGLKAASVSSWCPEDSGYCTITPSSADSANQFMVHDSIENLDPNATSAYFYPDRYIYKRRQNSIYESSANAILEFTTGVKDFSTPGVHDDDNSFRHCCSTITELTGTVQELPKNESSKRVRRPLKRQHEIDETDLHSEEFLTPYVCEEYGENNPDLSVSERLRNLAVNDEPTNGKIRPKRARTTGTFTRSVSLLSTPTLDGVHNSRVDLDTSDYFSRSHITLDDSAKQASLLYPTTPVKSSRRTVINLSPELTFQNRLQRTPEKSKVDPQFAEEYLQLEGRFAKRLNFAAPIGSPEKNQILYPTLRPVTPPKKEKTPEKCKKSLKGNAKCKRFLLRRSLCGLEKVDFLKMLGEQQDQRPAIQNILTYLNGEDVCRMCLVSQTWRIICQQDHKANRRRKTHIDFRRTTKENFNITIAPKKKIVHSKSYDCSRSLKEIRNNINIMQVPESSNAAQTSPPVSPSRRRFRMFLKAASQGQSQLTMCIRCRRPARVNSERRAECQHSDCATTFCPRCLNEPHTGHCSSQLEAPSPSKRLPNCATVATAKSRRNLKRL